MSQMKTRISLRLDEDKLYEIMLLYNTTSISTALRKAVDDAIKHNRQCKTTEKPKSLKP